MEILFFPFPFISIHTSHPIVIYRSHDVQFSRHATFSIVTYVMKIRKTKLINLKRIDPYRHSNAIKLF